MANLIEYFIPDDFVDDTGIERKRARIAVKTTYTVVFWAVLAAAISGSGGSIHSAIALVVCAATVATAPFVLRSTGKLNVAGHLIVTPVYVLLFWLIHGNGGLEAPAIVWPVMVPLLATLFQGKRAAKVWLFVVVASWLAVLGATLAGYHFPTVLPPKVAVIQRGISLVGVGVTAFIVLRLKDNLQLWLTEELRQKETETRAVLETAPDGIVTIDTEGTVLTANAAAARIFARDTDEMLGHHIRELVSSLDTANLADAVEAPVFGQTLEHTGRRGDEETFPNRDRFRHARGAHGPGAAGHHRPQAGQTRGARRSRRRRPGQPGQERLLGQYEPRAAYSAQRGDRLFRDDPRGDRVHGRRRGRRRPGGA